MAYTRDDYIKDLIIATQHGMESSHARLRVKLYEVGQTSKIEEIYPEFADVLTASTQPSTAVKDNGDDFWSSPAVVDSCKDMFGGNREKAILFLRHAKSGYELDRRCTEGEYELLLENG